MFFFFLILKCFYLKLRYVKIYGMDSVYSKRLTGKENEGTFWGNVNVLHIHRNLGRTMCTEFSICQYRCILLYVNFIMKEKACRQILYSNQWYTFRKKCTEWYRFMRKCIDVCNLPWEATKIRWIKCLMEGQVSE